MLDQLPYLVTLSKSQHSLLQCLGQLHFLPILSEDGLSGRKAHGKHMVSQRYSKDTSSTITATFTNLSNQVRFLQHEYYNTTSPQLQLEMQWAALCMGYISSQGGTLVSRRNGGESNPVHKDSSDVRWWRPKQMDQVQTVWSRPEGSKRRYSKHFERV